MEIIKKSFDYKSKIDYIIHISDIHIPLFKRQDEYKEVFNTLYEKIKTFKSNLKIKKNTNIPLIVVITGDLLHSKTDLSPECINNTYNFIKNLLKLVPVIIIPGNHDVNMNNTKRLDSITPILADLSDNHQLYYLLNSGIYTLNNIVFSHASIFDYNIIPADEIKVDENQTKIALFHGRINGVELNNGFTLSGEKSKNTNKTITVSAFNNYDMVLLGDIHNHQFIKENIAYAGSLIQQNIGEDLDKHGLILWNVQKRTGVFHKIKNNYGYLQVTIDNKKLVNDKYAFSADEINPNIPKNIRMRVLYKNTPISTVEEFITISKIHHNVIEAYHQNIDDSAKKNNSDSKLLQINLTSPEEQNKYIEMYLRENTEATNEDIELIKQQNIKLNNNIDIETVVELRNFKLIKLEFSNLFSYGINNHIVFSDLNGIVGIIADNHMGKSSILEILLFAIYDKFSRKGGIKDMINNRRKNFKIHVTLQIEDYEYHILKSGTRNSSGGVSQKLSFYRTKGKINECLDEDTMAKTKSAIQKYFGNYNDIVNTNFSIQNNSNQFIDSENTARKKELERILNIDFIDELHKKANEIYTKNKCIFEHLSKKINPELGSQLAKAKKQNLIELENINTIKKQCKELLVKKRNDLIELHKNVKNTDFNIDETINLEDLENKLKSLISEETNLLLKISNFKKDNDIDNSFNLDTENIEESLQNIDVKYKDNLAKYNKKIEKYTKLKYECKDSLRNIINVESEQNIEELREREKKINDEINVLTHDIENNSNIDTDIENIETQLKTNQETHLKLESDSLPESLQNFIKNNKSSTLRKNFKKDEELLVDYLKISDDDYCKSKEYKNYSESSKQFHFYNELNNHNKTTSKNNKQLITEKENLEILLCNKKKDKVKVFNMKLKLNEKNNELETLQKEMARLIDIQNKNETNEEYNKNKLEEIEKHESSLKKYLDAKNELEEIINDERKQINNIIILNNLQNTQSTLKQTINTLTIDVNNYKKNYDIIESNKKNHLDIETINDEIKQIEDKEKEIDISFNRINANIIKTMNEIKEYKAINVERKEHEKKKILNLWYKESLKKLPYFIIENVVPIIEKKANDLLSIITDFNISIEINDSKIDLYLKRTIYDNTNIILNNASGFEKFVSSLAIRLAILSVSNLPKINFIAIDEGWSCLDNHNVNNVKTILEYISQNFDFVLTISHLTEIKQHCDHQILLKKDDSNYSCVEYN